MKRSSIGVLIVLTIERWTKKSTIIQTTSSISTFNNDMGLFNNDLPYTATIKGLPVLISTSTYNTIAFVRIHKYFLSIL